MSTEVLLLGIMYTRSGEGLLGIIYRRSGEDLLGIICTRSGEDLLGIIYTRSGEDRAQGRCCECCEWQQGPVCNLFSPF